MASRQFINPAITWIPQAGFSASYTENGGIEATQDFRVRNSDLKPGSPLGAFTRGATWESVWPEVPELWRLLTIKTLSPTDLGDGWSMVNVMFTGYQYAGNGSSGEETTVPTTSLDGQLNATALSDHPKWVALDQDQKFGLGLILSGQAVSSPDFTKVGSYDDTTGTWSAWENDSGEITLTGDAITFAKIIMEGEQTWDKGGWTYSYHTESETGFTAAQLNSLGKIVANPPGSPAKPSTGWTWQLANPNQAQSGPKRFVKTLNFKLIQDNAKNQFLYGE
jgi:hypothetical protein